MRAITRSVALSVVLALLGTGCTTLRQSVRDRLIGAGNQAEFRGTAGAGFAGVRIAEVLTLPVVLPDSVTTDSVDLIANHRTSWRPALSTGLQVMVYSNTRSEAGLGLGAHMVFVPDAGGRTSPFPAITAHVGNRGHEIFFGALFMPSDRIRLPNGEDRYRVAASATGTYPDFILESDREWNWKQPTLYMGIQIGGVRVGERNAQEADAVSSGAVAASIALDLDTENMEADSVIKVDSAKAVQLRAEVTDASGRALYVPVRWSSEDPSVAAIFNNSSLLGVKSGTAYVNASTGSFARRFKVVVSGATKDTSAAPADTTPPAEPPEG